MLAPPSPATDETPSDNPSGTIVARPIARRALFARFSAALALAWLVAVPAARAQDGLIGDYYDDESLTVFVESRVDPVIDFTNWGAAPTGTSVAADSRYSERWTGFVHAPTAGNWTFKTISNDGVRLWVDNTQIINNWTLHAATANTGVVNLAAGWHPITLEHFQKNGGVVIQLLFSGPGMSEQIIPASHLATGQVGGNIAPVADAGPDLIVQLPDTFATLNGSGNDVDGTVVSYAWTQVVGPPAGLLGASTANLTVSGLLTTTPYEFELTVTDDQGATDTDRAQLMVLASGVPGGSVSGPLVRWQSLTVDFTGPTTSEASTPNPFRDYRLNVYFAHLASGKVYTVPGFFAADGNAAETSAAAGNVWRVRFTPDEAGDWIYQASFRTGADVAVSLVASAGTPTSFDNSTGFFTVGPTDPAAPGFLAEGRLINADEHFLRFQGSGRPFLKAGANSPENLLAYADFDQTTPTHFYAPHAGDWQPGDPQWKNDRGRELIGAMNYLAGTGMNSVYFLTFNVAGDGDDVWPWTTKVERERFDVSKLAQWEIVFTHMDELGLMLHVVTQETENDDGNSGLDIGNLGIERKLYYRELVARFGHHLAVQWNLGEENSNQTDDLEEFYDYFKAIDADDHPIVLHTFPWQIADKYDPMLDRQLLEGASLQTSSVGGAHAETLLWRSESKSHGKPWAVSLDEFGPAADGVEPDAEDFWHDNIRINGLWGNLMAGGAGCEWYFGYNHAHNDLDCEDWRSRANMWAMSRHALDFFEAYLPFDSMVADDSLVSGASGWCLAKPGEAYAVFLKDGGTPQLNLTGDAAEYEVHWFDPRLGGDLQTSTVTHVIGGGVVGLGAPPSSPGLDWAVLLRALPAVNAPPLIVSAGINPNPLTANTTMRVVAVVDDPNGLDDIASVRAFFFTGDFTFLIFLVLPETSPGNYSLNLPVGTQLGANDWNWIFQVVDNGGLEDLEVVPVTSLP